MDPRFDPETMIGETADWSTSWRNTFDEPLDLSQIDYIQFGDTRFPVEPGV